MSKVKAVLDFYKNTLPKKAVELADLCEEIGILTFSGEYAGKVVANAGVTAVYADHVTAELQAENAAVRAKVAELESEQSFKNGMKDLLLQAMDSASEMPVYPVDLETEDGSYIKAFIAIKIQSVGVTK